MTIQWWLYKRFTPKGPCTQIVYTLALRYFLYRYIGPKVYTIGYMDPKGTVAYNEILQDIRA